MSTNVTFSVVAVGTNPLSYQWQSGSTNLVDSSRIVGSTSSLLTIVGVQLSDTGSYRAFVTNVSGSATSSYAPLYISVVTYPPLIINHPVNQTVIQGNTASFTVLAIGNPLYYQWVSGSTNLSDNFHITGSNSASIRIINVQESDTGSYQVIVSNSSASVTSNTASLTVILGVLSTTDLKSYISGPYDTFEAYSSGSSPGNSGYGWSGGWVLKNPKGYTYPIVVARDNADGLETGWIGDWS